MFAKFRKPERRPAATDPPPRARPPSAAGRRPRGPEPRADARRPAQAGRGRARRTRRSKRKERLQRDQARAAQGAARQPQPRRPREGDRAGPPDRDPEHRRASRSRRWASSSTARSGRSSTRTSTTRCRGLGPLEALLKDDTRQRHPGQRPAADLRRAGGQAPAHRHHLQGRAAPAADHRQDRLGRGPARRRIEPLRGRPPRRRLALQRHGAAGRGGRLAGVDPEVQEGQARHRRPRRASAPSPRRWRPTCRRRCPPASTSSSRAAPARARRPRSTRCRPSSTTTSGS